MASESIKLKTNLLIILLYVLFDRTLESVYILSIEWINIIYAFLSKVATIFIFLRVLSLKHVNSFIIRLSILILFLLCYLIVITLLNGGDVRRAFMVAYPQVALISLMLIECRKLEKAKIFFHSISLLFSLLLVINLFFMIINPTFFGQTKTGGAIYFLAKENGVVYPLLMGFVFNGLDYLFNKKKSKLIFYAIGFGITMLLSGSSTSLTGTALLFSALFIPPFYRIIRNINTSVIVASILTFFFVIVVLGNVSFLEGTFVSRMIADLFEKDLTFSGRTFIWAVAFGYILESPIFGHGLKESTNIFYVFQKRVDKPDYVGTYSAHNEFVQLLYEGGIIFVFVLLVILFLFCKKIDKHGKSPLNVFFKCIIMSIIVLYMFEAIGFHEIIYIIIIGSISLVYYQNLFLMNNKRFV